MLEDKVLVNFYYLFFDFLFYQKFVLLLDLAFPLEIIEC